MREGDTRITKASDLMTTNVVAARESTTGTEISTRLLIGEFNGVPVIDNGMKVTGIVTAADILRAVRQGKNLDSLHATDIMTRNPAVVKQDTEIDEIIDIMLQKVIVLVPVIDDENKLIGVVARLDILREKLNEKFVTIGERGGLSKT
ncbi:MAG TPA: CBS domain-containing protein [Candidatus Nitrosopolaris sp.]|nr:CBS domain-containing protein [Candidatus Nitrosopolaris sp.]